MFSNWTLVQYCPPTVRASRNRARPRSIASQDLDQVETSRHERCRWITLPIIIGNVQPHQRTIVNPLIACTHETKVQWLYADVPCIDNYEQLRSNVERIGRGVGAPLSRLYQSPGMIAALFMACVARAANKMPNLDDPAVQTRWGKVGKQKIVDEGPLAPFPNMKDKQGKQRSNFRRCRPRLHSIWRLPNAGATK